jgi:aminoglycoside phosphotransferase family enzyme/predicted kinase
LPSICADEGRRDFEQDQLEVVAFLSRPETYGTEIGTVDRLTTHISHIFLAGLCAYKLKRAVRLAYVDFSTLEARRASCDREIALNRRTAPELYLGVVAVVRTDSGVLQLGGQGVAVEWLVAMRRFDQDCLLDNRVAVARLSPETLRCLADEIAQLHRAAEKIADCGGAGAMRAIIVGNTLAFASARSGAFDLAVIDRLQQQCGAHLDAVADLLDARRRGGKVRRCHGDLHLRNICLIDGRPILFDCIEFSDALSMIDVLYDVAFLLMDLAHRRLDAEANVVFNRYLDVCDEDEGLAALPLFLALRAAIRGHVTAAAAGDDAHLAEARSYVDLALRLVEPEKPRLVAIGGLSGTGKSTLARQLGPGLARSPGARILRSDVIRKSLFGLAPEARLGPEGYTEEVTARVYARMFALSQRVLQSGRSVIADAVFARPEERRSIADCARKARVPFSGLWLEAPAEVLERRVAQRRGDASDADVTILRRQLTYDLGSIDWTRIDVSGDGDEVARSARRQIDHCAS